MFENAGRKLRSFAKILFWISVVCVTIIAIFLGIIAINYNFLIFITVLIGGILGVYVECLFLSAFGQLVESTSVTAEECKSISANTVNIKNTYQETRENRYISNTFLSTAPDSNTAFAKEAIKQTASVSSYNDITEKISEIKLTNPSVVYDVLSTSLKFKSDEACKQHIISNISRLNDNDKRFLAPIYGAGTDGIKEIVASLLKRI